MKKPNTVGLHLEQLPDRISPNVDFGNVTNSAGFLVIRTDGTNTDVSITWTSPDDVDVTDNVTATTESYQNVTAELIYQNLTPGSASDTVRVDADAFAVTARHTILTGDLADVVDIQTNGGSIGRLNAQLGGGADDLYLNTDAGGDITGDVTVNTGAGNDRFYLDDTDITGNLNITNPAGFDDLYFDVLTLTGKLTATLGNDGGDFYIDGLVSGGVSISAGGGGHDIAIDSGGAITQSLIGGDLTMISGSGNDGLYLDRTTITGNLIMSSGDGNDTLYIEYSTAVTGSVTMNAGAGDDDITVDDDVIFAGNASIDAGAGANDIDVNEAVTIGGLLTINAGAGNDTIDIADTTVTSFLTINAGDGTNFLYLEDSAGDGGITAGASVIITGGTGADHLSINASGDGFTVAGSLFLNLGAGANTWDLDQNFAVVGNMSIVSGTGDDALTLFATTAGTIGGSLTMNLGNGANTFIFRGSVGTGSVGALTYIGGAGVDLVTINGFVARQLTVMLGAANDTFAYGALFSTTNPTVFTGYVDGGDGTDTYNATLVPAIINTRTLKTRFEIISP